MVKLKFIVKGGALMLRISEFKERYYRNVGHLLKGEPNIAKHWNADKERFTAYALFHKENNRVLDEYKAIYLRLIMEHPEMTARQVAYYYKGQQMSTTNGLAVAWSVSEYKDSVSKFLEVVIEREKAKQGCNYEIYYKLLLKCRKVIPGFDWLKFSELDFNKLVGFASMFAAHKGYRFSTKAFRALLGKAHKDADVEFNIAQIGAFSFNDYNPDRYVVKDTRPDVLTEEQLKQFFALDVASSAPSYARRKRDELFQDFCVFMFHTFFAPCDVIKAKYKDLTSRGTITARRKKTHRAVEVPVTPVMRAIIDKYRGTTKNGYIFPIMDDEKEKEYATRDFTYRKFGSRLNTWLKGIGKRLGTEFGLYAYVFRHTAITVALNNGLPIAYVANAAGTSIEMIQKHYYNGDNETNRNRLAAAFMDAIV